MNITPKDESAIYKTMVQHMHEAVYLIDADDGTILNTNPAFDRIFGYESSSCINQDVRTLHPSDQIPLELTNALSSSGDWRGEIRCLRKNNDIFWADLSVATFSLSPEKSVRICVLEDIQTQKTVAEELRLNHLMFENMKEGVFLVRACDGVLIYTNPNFLKLFNYNESELKGNHIDLLYTEDALQETKTGEVFQQLNQQRNWSGNLNCKRKNGSVFPAHVKMAAFNSPEHGDVWISVLEDITEQQLLEDQLRKSKELAETASVAKANFLATMSHEIRTPLNGLIGSLDLLEESPLDEEQKEILDIAKHSGDHLFALVNDILDYTKLDAGRMELANMAFDLPSCINDIYNRFKERATKKGLIFDIELERDIPQQLAGDSGRLTQVLVNLIDNAFKFTIEGHVRIKVRTIANTEQQVTLLFSIKDTGIGIPQENIEELFQVFTQFDNSNTRKYSGTGLGLALCRGLVQTMGGKLQVKSKEGMGSIFSFSAAFSQVADAPPKPKKIYERKITQNTDRHVLLVEDNPINQKVTSKILIKGNYTCDIVENGQKALKAIQEKSYHIILMDLQMPVMDGFVATERIRSGPHQPEVPIIALTANAQKGVREECLQAGMNDYLSKPLKMNSLYQMLEKYIG